MSRFGICSILYRKRRVVIMFLGITLFWLIYLFLALPDKSDAVRRFEAFPTFRTNTDHNNHDTQEVLHSAEISQNHPDDVPQQKPESFIVVDIPDKNISLKLNIETIPKIVDENKTSTTNKTAPVEKQESKVNAVFEQIKNKTFEVGAKMKNKTIEKLTDLGFLSKQVVHISEIVEPSILNISISQDEFLYIIKSLMNKEHNEDTVFTPSNLTANSSVFTGNAPNGSRNLCDCRGMICSCCVNLVLGSLQHKHVRRACTNFTFIPKSQKMDYLFSLDDRLTFNRTISADHPPSICLGSQERAIEICTHYHNITYKVNIHERQKSQLSGCLGFTLGVYNVTISRFPLGCFQIPAGDETITGEEDRGLLGNWVP